MKKQKKINNIDLLILIIYFILFPLSFFFTIQNYLLLVFISFITYFAFWVIPFLFFKQRNLIFFVTFFLINLIIIFIFLKFSNYYEQKENQKIRDSIIPYNIKENKKEWNEPIYNNLKIDKSEIDVKKLDKWKEKNEQNLPKYNLYENNCSDMVLKALDESWFEVEENIWFNINPVTTPSNSYDSIKYQLEVIEESEKEEEKQL